MVLEFYWTFNRLPRFTQSWSANENDDGNTEIIKHRRIVCQIKEPEGNWATNNEKTIPTVFVQSRMEQLQVEWRSLEMISYFLPPDFANMRTIEFYWSDRYFHFFSLRKSKPVIHLSHFFFISLSFVRHLSRFGSRKSWFNSLHDLLHLFHWPRKENDYVNLSVRWLNNRIDLSHSLSRTFSWKSNLIDKPILRSDLNKKSIISANQWLSSNQLGPSNHVSPSQSRILPVSFQLTLSAALGQLFKYAVCPKS